MCCCWSASTKQKESGRKLKEENCPFSEKATAIASSLSHFTQKKKSTSHQNLMPPCLSLISSFCICCIYILHLIEFNQRRTQTKFIIIHQRLPTYIHQCAQATTRLSFVCHDQQNVFLLQQQILQHAIEALSFCFKSPSATTLSSWISQRSIISS